MFNLMSNFSGSHHNYPLSLYVSVSSGKSLFVLVLYELDKLDEFFSVLALKEIIIITIITPEILFDTEHIAFSVSSAVNIIRPRIYRILRILYILSKYYLDFKDHPFNPNYPCSCYHWCEQTNERTVVLY